MKETNNLRLQELHLSIKEFCEICNKRDVKVSYNMCLNFFKGEIVSKLRELEAILNQLEKETHSEYDDEIFFCEPLRIAVRQNLWIDSYYIKHSHRKQGKKIGDNDNHYVRFFDDEAFKKIQKSIGIAV